MDNNQRQQIKKYVDLAMERWRLITTCLLIAITAGLLYYLSIPKIYQSLAVLSYEQRQVNPTKMDPEQGKNLIQDAVATLKEVVLSRNSLEKVIGQFELYSKEKKKLPIEDVIELMRKNISVTPSNRGDVFNITFQDHDPVKTAKVTNALSSLFIEENLKYREERASETSKYTQDELSMAKKVMDVEEQKMRDFKLKYYNEMPEQRAGNLERLNKLNEQSQKLQESIQNLERTKIMAQEQAAMMQRLSAGRSAGEQGASIGPTASSVGVLSDADRLVQLRRYYSSLLVRYTDKHPEVRRTKQLIEQLEGQVGTEKPSGRARATSAGAGSARYTEGAEVGRLQLQAAEYDANIKQLRSELAELPAEIAKYKRWIEATPTREAEWSGLTRDYTELRRNYDELVARSLQAISSETLERKQKGSKFKIIDPARIPDKPFKPNFLKVFFAAVGAGLGLGFILTVLLDFIDTSFKDTGEIEAYVGLPVICTVSLIEKKAETHKRKTLFVLSVVFFSVYGVALLAALSFLWRKGLIII